MEDDPSPAVTHITVPTTHYGSWNQASEPPLNTVTQTVAQRVSLVLIMVVGMVENTMVIASILLHATGSCRSVHLQLVINLCVVDILTIVACLPIPLLRSFGDISSLTGPVCRALSWLSMTLYSVHNITLLLILLDRLASTKMPIWYFQKVKEPMVKTYVKVAVVTMWIISIILSSGCFLPQTVREFSAISQHQQKQQYK